MGIRVGAVWCTTFDRGWRSTATWRPLRHGYRNPTHAASVFAERGDDIVLIECDEDVDPGELAQRVGDEPLDLLYVLSHGVSVNGNYSVLLPKVDWEPMSEWIPTRVAVFDTCNLLPPGGAADSWESGVDENLRIILGFEGLATVGKGIARGRAFAECIASGEPICRSWIAAVNGASTKQAPDVPVALALGDDDDDADAIFKSSRIDTLPGPRSDDTASVRCGHTVA